MSLRGPGAGSLTPGSVPASNPCLNCGANIQLVYCPECGQREIDPDPTFREFVNEAAEQLLGWDGKLVQSFRLLVTKPGLLTQEYLAGRRVRYLTPLRMYLTASVLYFFVAAIAPERTFATVAVSTPAATAGLSDAQAGVAGPEVSRRIQRGVRAASRDMSGFNRAWTTHLPTLVFFLVPVFALAMWVAYHRPRRRLPQHLAFALHVHAVAFAVAIPYTLLRFANSRTLDQIALTVMLAGVLWWVYAGSRRVYGMSTAATALRTTLAGLLYATALALTVSVTMMGIYYNLGAPPPATRPFPSAAPGTAPAP